MSAQPAIRFVDVHKRFGDNRVLEGVSLDVAQGSVHFVIGESGVGKSVLIKQVVGLLRPDSGRVEFDGRDLTGLDEAGYFSVRERCQMIFQNATLFDGLTVRENVAMPLCKRFRVARQEARRRAREALEMVQARHLEDRLPGTLGQGVRKRVAIARALALEPEALLYDEPTTGLDPVAARRTDRLIRDMADRLGLTSLVVSHDLQSVRAIGDRVTFLHQGSVCFEGSAGDLFSSENSVVRRFVEAGARRG
jgi:phospholipid/cholesterol/gamma-HCH transport system ATP-binding protein